MIIRRKHNSAFTVIPNAIATDMRLSIEARWLMWYLLTKPDDWTVRVSDLQKASGVGRDKAYAMVRECILAGYIVREKHTDGTINYLVKDQPNRPIPEKQEKGFPEDQEFPEKPDPEEPDPENTDALLRTDLLSNTERKSDFSEFPQNKENPKRSVTWVRDAEERWWPLASRWKKERGAGNLPKPVGSRHENGLGFYFPTEWADDPYSTRDTGNGIGEASDAA